MKGVEEDERGASGGRVGGSTGGARGRGRAFGVGGAVGGRWWRRYRWCRRLSR